MTRNRYLKSDGLKVFKPLPMKKETGKMERGK